MATVDFTLDALVYAEKPSTYGFKDLTGNTFGRLCILGLAGKSQRKKSWDWYALCSCKNIVRVNGHDVTHKNTSSCGCLKREETSKRAKTHGERLSIEYRVYCGIKRRCENPNEKTYPRYGGRGICVKLSFEEFLEEVGRRPGDEFQIERINNDAHYEKGNLRWATRVEQCNNRSSSMYVTVGEETKTYSEWARKQDLSPATIWKRLNRGWCAEHTVLLPNRSQKPKDCLNCNPHA